MHSKQLRMCNVLMLQVCEDLVREWMVENGRKSILMGTRNEYCGGTDEMSISGTATYQPFHGIMELKMVYCTTLLASFFLLPQFM